MHSDMIRNSSYLLEVLRAELDLLENSSESSLFPPLDVSALALLTLSHRSDLDGLPCSVVLSITQSCESRLWLGLLRACDACSRPPGFGRDDSTSGRKRTARDRSSHASAATEVILKRSVVRYARRSNRDADPRLPLPFGPDQHLAALSRPSPGSDCEAKS